MSYFKIETAQAASKLCELIELGGDAIIGPWDGKKAITLIPDFDAGAISAMTGGGYLDGIRKIVDAHTSGDTESVAELYQQWLPLINYENRQCGLAACKALMMEGGVIRSDTTRHLFAPMHPSTRASLMKVARRHDADAGYSQGLRIGYEQKQRSTVRSRMLARGCAAKSATQGQAALFLTTAAAFRANSELHEEIFGTASLIVRCPTWLLCLRSSNSLKVS